MHTQQPAPNTRPVSDPFTGTFYLSGQVHVAALSAAVLSAKWWYGAAAGDGENTTRVVGSESGSTIPLEPVGTGSETSSTRESE